MFAIFSQSTLQSSKKQFKLLLNCFLPQLRRASWSAHDMKVKGFAYHELKIKEFATHEPKVGESANHELKV